MFGTGQRRESKVAKLHSIPAVLRGRRFEGSFNLAGIDYQFTYQPARAAIRESRLELTGRLKLTVKRQTARVPAHSLESVRATLIAAQGGIGTAPARDKQPPDV